QAQPAGDETQAQGSRTDECDFLRLRRQQARGQLAHLMEPGAGKNRFLIILSGEGGAVLHRLSYSPWQRTHSGMSQKNLLARDWKFVLAKLFVGEQLGQRHHWN